MTDPFDGINLPDGEAPESVPAPDPEPKPRRKRKRRQPPIPDINIPISEEPPLPRQPRRSLKRQKVAPDYPEDRDSDEKLERGALLSTLIAYGQNDVLGPYLCKERKFKLDAATLRKLSLHGMLQMREDIETALSTNTTDMGVTDMCRKGMEKLERVIHFKTPLKIKGTTTACFNDKSWRFMFERVKMQHMGFAVNVDPVTQLAIATARSMLLAHGINTAQLPTPGVGPTFVGEEST